LREQECDKEDRSAVPWAEETAGRAVTMRTAKRNRVSLAVHPPTAVELRIAETIIGMLVGKTP
jgi:hypothetical protein